MNYKIIQDEKAFKEFIEWLPDLEDGEQFYFSLFARSKYAPQSNLKADKGQLKRGTATKERLFQKIKQLEIELGGYDVKGIEAPQESLALYITPNPRSMKKASIKTLKELADNIGKDRYQNPKTIALNAIQVSKGRNIYLDFDFDMDKDYINLDNHIKNAIGDGKHHIIQTKGGYHVLVKLDSIPKDYVKVFYKRMMSTHFVDQAGDLLLPVVGCSQGGFTPKLIR